MSSETIQVNDDPQQEFGLKHNIMTAHKGSQQLGFTEKFPSDDSGSFSCLDSTYSWRNRRINLPYQMKQVNTKEKPFSCTECNNYTANSKGLITRHMKCVHSDEKPFACHECTYSCKFKYKLELHVRTVHSGEKPFSCSKCSFRSKYKVGLDRHIKTIHSGARLSELTYKNNGRNELRLQQHFKVDHSDKITFSCPDCKFKCKSKSISMSHLKDVHSIDV